MTKKTCGDSDFLVFPNYGQIDFLLRDFPFSFTKKFRQIKSMPQIMLTLLNAACSHIYKNATAFTTSARSKVSDYAGMLENCQMEIIVTAKGLLYTLTSKNLHTPS